MRRHIASLESSTGPHTRGGSTIQLANISSRIQVVPRNPVQSTHTETPVLVHLPDWP